jgi:hypothetical protein
VSAVEQENEGNAEIQLKNGWLGRAADVQWQRRVERLP